MKNRKGKTKPSSGSCLLAFCLAFVLTSTAQDLEAGVIIITPETWGTLADGGGGAIDGNIDFSEIDNRIISGYSTTTPEIFHGIFEFDLSVISEIVDSAFLNLDVYRVRGPEETISYDLFGYAGDGSITDSDFSIGSNLLSFSISAVGAFNVDVSTFVATAIANGDQFQGFVVRPTGDPLVNDTNYWFNSPSAGPVGSSALQVTSSVIPEPSTCALLVLGLAVLGSGRRKSRLATC